MQWRRYGVDRGRLPATGELGAVGAQVGAAGRDPVSLEMLDQPVLEAL
ncbi:MAG: hypothetical protein M3069_02215 [Chloroflexota bacterium]|nr:hypothetical protein [Chloroflexota bacterium]